MAVYTPSTLPDTTDVSELKDWLLNELLLIADAIPSDGALKIRVRNSAPDKPRNGMIVYADGTSWNPGSGVGFYGYENGSWVKL
jgi:hypothetical protein